MLELNNEQNRVIYELDRNILLLASAGTGKTNTLAYRVANIIKSNRAKGDEILCITFTNKACNEMKERIYKIVGIEGKKVVVKTFHSFAFDVIKKYTKLSSDLFADFIIYDEDDCREIVKTINYYNHPVESLHRFIDFIKEYKYKNNIDSYSEVVKIVYKDKIDYIERICQVNYKPNYEMIEELREKAHYILSVYDNVLNSNHGVDFNDLLIKLKEIFSRREVLNEVRMQYKFINIDEVQDTSEEEYLIVEKLFNGCNVLLCGDTFQTIYEWRGSNPMFIFNRYREKYNPIEIVFNQNYRGSKILTEVAYQYIKGSFENKVDNIYKEGIKAVSNKVGTKIKFKKCSNIKEEAEWIYKEIKKLNLDNNDGICVLTRSNNYNIDLSNNFIRFRNLDKSEKKLDFALIDQFKFFRRQEIKDIIAYLKLILNSNDTMSFIRILRRVPLGISERVIKELLSLDSKLIGIKITDFLDEKIYEDGDYFKGLINGYEEGNIVVYDVESTGVNTTEDEIIQIAAIKLDRYGKVKEVFERFLKSSKSVGDSVSVHGFNDEYISEHGEEKIKVLGEFLDFTKNTVIVGHNVSFDVEILKKELNNNGLGVPKFKGIYDTLDIYRRFYINLNNYKLETLSRLFKTEHIPDHNAMNDILATGELLIKAIIEKIIPTKEGRVSLSGKYKGEFYKVKCEIDKIKDGYELRRGYELIGDVVNKGKLKEVYKKDLKRMNNMRDFYRIAKMIDDEEKSNEESLIDLIKITGLSNGDIENLFSRQNRIPIITIHQCKGLEFSYVFLAGLSDGIFPTYISIKNNNLEEEKRLFYVAITRAKDKLYMSYIEEQNGKKREKSRLLNKINKNYMEID